MTVFAHAMVRNVKSGSLIKISRKKLSISANKMYEFNYLPMACEMPVPSPIGEFRKGPWEKIVTVKTF